MVVMVHPAVVGQPLTGRYELPEPAYRGLEIMVVLMRPRKAAAGAADRGRLELPLPGQPVVPVVQGLHRV
jgi:hypothetical protein